MLLSYTGLTPAVSYRLAVYALRLCSNSVHYIFAQEAHRPDVHLPVNMTLAQRAVCDAPHIQNDVPTQNAMHERGASNRNASLCVTGLEYKSVSIR